MKPKQDRRTSLYDALPTVFLNVLDGASLLHGGIAARAGQCQHHGLVEDDEPLRLLDGRLCRRGILVHDKRLALCAQVRLGHNVDNGAKLGKDGFQGGAQRLGLHALLQVAHVDTKQSG